MRGIDLDYLSTDELKDLICDANYILKQRKEGEYKGLVNGVLNAIKALENSGYGYYDAFDAGDDCGAYTWADIRNECEAHYRNMQSCYEEN